MSGHEGGEMTESEALDTWEGQDKEFVLDTGVGWTPAEKCHTI